MNVVAAITKAALDGLKSIYRDGLHYCKVEILLLDLSHRAEIAGDLSAVPQPVVSIIGVFDAVNVR